MSCGAEARPLLHLRGGLAADIVGTLPPSQYTGRIFRGASTSQKVYKNKN